MAKATQIRAQVVLKEWYFKKQGKGEVLIGVVETDDTGFFEKGCTHIIRNIVSKTEYHEGFVVRTDSYSIMLWRHQERLNGSSS